METVFAACLIVLGAGLGAIAWHHDGLPRTAADRMLDVVLTDEQRIAIDLTLAFALVALGICTFA